MSSPRESFKEMRLEPEVTTELFHQVLGALVAEGRNDDEVVYLEQLLHIPLYHHPQWEAYALQLAAEAKIPTVSLDEVMRAYEPGESPREWQILAMRVVLQRRKVAGVLQKDA